MTLSHFNTCLQQEAYNRTIRLGFIWKRAKNITKNARANHYRGSQYKLETVTHFSNNISNPANDGGSPRQFFYNKMGDVKNQEKVAKAKKENDKKAESEMKAKIKMIKKAPSLFRDKCLSDSNFDVRKKITEDDIARAEKEIKEVESMQTVIPPASDLVSSRASNALVEHMSTSNTQSLLFIILL